VKLVKFLVDWIVAESISVSICEQGRGNRMSTVHRSSLLTVAIVATAVLALTLGFFAVRTAQAQDTHTAFNCDAATVALVFAAMDAYGYQPSFDLSGMGSASADQAKLDFSKVSPSLQGEPATTPEPDSGNDTSAGAGNDTTASSGTGTGVSGSTSQTFNANCSALRAEASNFVFGQLGIRAVGAGGATDAITPRVEGDNVFFVQLSGPQEVPGPGDADAIGEGSVTIDPDAGTVCWTYNVAGISFITGQHIHVGAEGESGSVVVPLVDAQGNFPNSGCTTAAADVISAILSNPIGHYFNIHTDEFPNGALRGQLLDS
jgi:hypothetical protein